MGSYAETWILAGGEIIGVTDDVIQEGRLELSDEISIVGTVKDPSIEEILSLSPDFILLSPDIENHVDKNGKEISKDMIVEVLWGHMEEKRHLPISAHVCII